jgi:predicted nucleotidyltransferase
MHHYRRMAEHAVVDNIHEGNIRIKKLFYILRPLLACRWIVRKGSQPPTEFATLVEQPWVLDDERRWIKELLQIKADAMEAHSIAIPDEQVESLRRELGTYQATDAAVSQPAKERNFSELDRLLRENVLS